METVFISTENTEICSRLVAEIRFRSLNKHVALQNLSIYYTWKNIRQQYKNKKLKIIAPAWNDEFELPGCSYKFVNGLD